MYVCGRSPRFYYSCGPLGKIASHPQHEDPEIPGAIRGFSPMNCAIVDRGLVLCGEGYVAFALIVEPERFNVHLPLIAREVPLHATPHHVVYHPAANGCLVVTSSAVPFRPRKAPFDVDLRISLGDDGTVQTAEIAPQPQTFFIDPLKRYQALFLQSQCNRKVNTALKSSETYGLCKQAVYDCRYSVVLRSSTCR